MKTKTPHRVHIVWGEKENVYQNGTESISSYEFDTAAELQAFLCGINEALGWVEKQAFPTKKEAEDYYAAVVKEFDGE